MPILEMSDKYALVGETYKKVCTLRRNNIFLSMEDISRQVGVTRQRVRAILLKEKLTTKAVTQRHVVYCKYCNDPTPDGQIVCPGECRENFYYTIINCRSCYRKVRYLKSYLKTRIKLSMNRYFYCSRDCYYAGRRDGIS